MDYVEAIKRMFERNPVWRAKDQWLMREPALLNVLGEETLQWYTTKFSTVTGIFHPYFALVADVGDGTLHQHPKIKQLRPLPIFEPQTCKNIRQVHQWREDAQQQLAPLRFCRSAGQYWEALRKVRPKLMDKIKHTFHNNVRSILRHYLYDLQPRDRVTMARLPKLEVIADGCRYKYTMELRDMTRPYQSAYREPTDADNVLEQIRAFNLAASAYVGIAQCP